MAALIEQLMGFENVYQLLRWRRNVCAAQLHKLQIARPQLSERLDLELGSLASGDVSVYALEA